MFKTLNIKRWTQPLREGKNQHLWAEEAVCWQSICLVCSMFWVLATQTQTDRQEDTHKHSIDQLFFGPLINIHLQHRTRVWGNKDPVCLVPSLRTWNIAHSQWLLGRWVDERMNRWVARWVDSQGLLEKLPKWWILEQEVPAKWCLGLVHTESTATIKEPWVEC